MQYGGFRFDNKTALDKGPKIRYDYLQDLGQCGSYVDIPIGYEDVIRYNGTLAHKTNFGFDRNVIITSVRVFL